MKDCLGKELHIGDKCVYMQNTMTGSSTHRKILYKGTVVGLTPKRVEFSGGHIKPDEVVRITSAEELTGSELSKTRYLVKQVIATYNKLLEVNKGGDAKINKILASLKGETNYLLENLDYFIKGETK